MGNCRLGDYFTKLKKSSKESVENILEFSDYNKYMHVERNIESELKNIIQNCNKKQLILLCGSVGDGKSHSLSYFKNELKLLDDFTIYNDATESFSPDYDCVKNLSNVLADFNDANINNLSDKKLIIAINLGTLSNFLNSEEASNYTLLKQYVEDTKILAANEVSRHVKSAFFNHVNFTDYKVFSLSKKGCKSDYILKLFSKVFNKNNENPFYGAYKKCSSEGCPFKDKCILRMNYSYCIDTAIHESLSKYIIEIIVKDKIIISTRQLLNFIYDIVIPANFNMNDIGDNERIYKDIDVMLNYSTPSLVFEHPELSNVFKSLSSVDPVLYSSEDSDGLAIEISAIDKLDDFISTHCEKNNVYSNYILQGYQANKFSTKAKLAVLKNIIRCNSLMKKESNDIDYNEFVNLLYSYYCGKQEEAISLESLYNYMKNAILSWYGNSNKNNLCQIKLSDSEVSLHEDMIIEYNPILNNYNIDGDVDKFLLNLDTRFQVFGKSFVFNVDYNLYNLVKKMSNGYRPNVDEKNKFISFSNIIDDIISNGNYKKSIIIIDKSTDSSYVLEASSFGGFSIRKEI